MDNNEYNPIRSVDGVSIKCPSDYKWKEQDISDNAAGRDSAYVMNKSRKAQIVALELKWKNVSIEDASAILKAFDPEYVRVCYLDAKAGVWRESEFYTGDRAAPLYNGELGVWKEISFNIIERKGQVMGDASGIS